MRLITLAALLAALASPAVAQSERPTAVPEKEQVEPAQDSKPVQVQTDTFVNKAAMTNMFEVEAGKVVAETSQNEEVRQFAQKMVQDHQKLNEQLEGAVEHHDVQATMPTRLDAKHQKALDALKEADAQSINQLYANSQVQVHREALNLFVNYGKSGENKVLRVWAKDTADAIRKHYQMAQNLPTAGDAPRS